MHSMEHTKFDNFFVRLVFRCCYQHSIFEDIQEVRMPVCGLNEYGLGDRNLVAFVNAILKFRSSYKAMNLLTR
jgi:hypothetical protein